MRAAVIGANWGGVHVAALREAGVEVAALAGRDAVLLTRAAQGMGIPRVVTDLRDLGQLQLDLITVATPPHTHGAVLAQLCTQPGTAALPLVCEKPAVGVHPSWLPPARTAPLWVNYAFAFLSVAEQVTNALPELGRVWSAEARTVFDLPGQLDAREWLLELASHPWSWLVQLFGPPAPGHMVAGEAITNITTSCGDVPVAVSVTQVPGFAGISHRVRLITDSGPVTVAGRYRVGQDWVFDPIQWPSGTDHGQPEPEPLPGDPWYRANARSIGAMVAAVGGAPPDPRLFSWEEALALDLAVSG